MADDHVFEMRDGVAVITIPHGQPFALATATVRTAIAQAIAGRCKNLIVDGRNVHFDPPSMAERHAMVRDWSSAADGRVRLAMVVRPEFVDSEKFAVVAAANFGLIANTFDNEIEAREWIRSLD